MAHKINARIGVLLIVTTAMIAPVIASNIIVKMILVRAVSVNMVHLRSARTIYQIGEKILCVRSKSQHIVSPGFRHDLDGDQGTVATTPIRNVR